MVPALIRANPSITKEKWGQDDCSLRPESNPYPFQFPPLLDDVIPVGCCRIILGDVTIHSWRSWGESVLTWGDTAPVADGLVVGKDLSLPFTSAILLRSVSPSLSVRSLRDGTGDHDTKHQEQQQQGSCCPPPRHVSLTSCHSSQETHTPSCQEEQGKWTGSCHTTMPHHKSSL